MEGRRAAQRWRARGGCCEGGQRQGSVPPRDSRLTPLGWLISRGSTGRGRGEVREDCPSCVPVGVAASAEDLRGRLWQQSPGAVGAAGARAKRKGSGLADEGLAKRRQEGT